MASWLPFAIAAGTGVVQGITGAAAESAAAAMTNRQRADALNALEQQLYQNAQAYFAGPRTAYDQQQALARALALWNQVLDVLAPPSATMPGQRVWDNWGRNGYEERKAGGSLDWEGKYVLAIQNDVPVGGAVAGAIQRVTAPIGLDWYVALAWMFLAGAVIWRVAR